MNKWVITIFNHQIQTNPFKLPKYDSGSNFRKEQKYTFENIVRAIFEILATTNESLN